MEAHVPSVESVRISRHQPIYRQITDRFRDLIVSGELPPGHKLPSTQELAASLGSDPATVHTALRVLVKEGLITRQPRRGTFVRERRAVLTQVGIFMGGAFRNASPYQRSLYGAVEDLLRKENLRYKLFVDPRPVEQQSVELPELAHSIQKGEIQALMGVQMDRRSLQWLKRLPIPSAYHVSGKEPGVVRSDLDQFSRLALDQLRNHGCRSVGVIAPFSLELEPPFDGRVIPTEFYLHFTDIARDLGMTLHNEWFRVPHAQVYGMEAGQRFGYEQFKALWALPARPEGLVIYPDSMVTGAILAMSELRVSVPQDLRLVLHRNKLVDMICPFSVTWIQSDETHVAAALLEQIHSQLRGEPCPPRCIPFTVLASEENIHCKSKP
jgi:DNA-binding LacI/PurR family transcriptional regulator